MAFASSSVICQNRALSSSVVSTPAVLRRRCYSRLQSQRLLRCNRRSNIGMDVASVPATNASSVVAKTAVSDAHVQSQSFSPAPGSGKYDWNHFTSLFRIYRVISSYWNNLRGRFD